MPIVKARSDSQRELNMNALSENFHKVPDLASLMLITTAKQQNALLPEYSKARITYREILAERGHRP